MKQATRTFGVRGAAVGLIAVVIGYVMAKDDDVSLGSLAEPAIEHPGISPMGGQTTPVPTLTASEPPAPVVTVEIVTVTEPVPFDKVTVEDPGVAAGTSAVTTVGLNGVRTLTYDVTYTDGEETGRTLVGDEVTEQPVDEVTTVGTAEEAEVLPLAEIEDSNVCDPNYDGCVPVASDVDCADGEGDGPAYAEGPLHVVGYDIYYLDADEDGLACERSFGSGGASRL